MMREIPCGERHDLRRNNDFNAMSDGAGIGVYRSSRWGAPRRTAADPGNLGVTDHIKEQSDLYAAQATRCSLRRSRPRRAGFNVDYGAEDVQRRSA